LVDATLQLFSHDIWKLRMVAEAVIPGMVTLPIDSLLPLMAEKKQENARSEK